MLLEPRALLPLHGAILYTVMSALTPWEGLPEKSLVFL